MEITDKNKIRKVLVIKIRGIGDVILSTVLIDNLVKDFPNATIDYLTEKPGSIVVKNLKEIKRTIIFENVSLIKRLKQIFTIRKQKYDLVIDSFSNPSSAIITFFSKAKYRLGFPYRGRTYAYNIYGPKDRDKSHSARLL